MKNIILIVCIYLSLDVLLSSCRVNQPCYNSAWQIKKQRILEAKIRKEEITTFEFRDSVWEKEPNQREIYTYDINGNISRHEYLGIDEFTKALCLMEISVFQYDKNELLSVRYDTSTYDWDEVHYFYNDKRQKIAEAIIYGFDSVWKNVSRLKLFTYDSLGRLRSDQEYGCTDIERLYKWKKQYTSYHNYDSSDLFYRYGNGYKEVGGCTGFDWCWEYKLYDSLGFLIGTNDNNGVQTMKYKFDENGNPIERRTDFTERRFKSKDLYRYEYYRLILPR